jgi:hypothetical protein
MEMVRSNLAGRRSLTQTDRQCGKSERERSHQRPWLREAERERHGID